MILPEPSTLVSREPEKFNELKRTLLEAIKSDAPLDYPVYQKCIEILEISQLLKKLCKCGLATMCKYSLTVWFATFFTQFYQLK